MIQISDRTERAIAALKEAMQAEFGCDFALIVMGKGHRLETKLSIDSVTESRTDLKWVGLTDQDERVSSLEVGTDARSIGITGGLSHGARVRPTTIADADALIEWLENWRRGQYKLSVDLSK